MQMAHVHFTGKFALGCTALITQFIFYAGGLEAKTQCGHVDICPVSLFAQLLQRHDSFVNTPRAASFIRHLHVFSRLGDSNNWHKYKIAKYIKY